MWIPAGGAVTIDLRLCERSSGPAMPAGPLFMQRIAEADAFYATIVEPEPSRAQIQRQAHAGLLWTKQCNQFNDGINMNGSTSNYNGHQLL
jgi:hypothetical protein